MTTEITILPDRDEWAQMKELANVAVKSGLLPATIKTPEAAAIIMLKGRELGIPPMVAFSHIHVIQGKPTMSAEIMLAYIRKDFPTAEINILETTDERCTIEAGRPGAKILTKFMWDMNKARRMGLADKDNWKKQPGTMLRWRVITEMKRVIFPEVLLGIDYTPEELGATVSSQGIVKDITPTEPPVTKTVKDLMNEEVPDVPQGESATLSSAQAPQGSSASPASPAESASSSMKEEQKSTLSQPDAAPSADSSSPPKSRTRAKAELQTQLIDVMGFLGWDNEKFVAECKRKFVKHPNALSVQELGEFLLFVEAERDELSKMEAPQ